MAILISRFAVITQPDRPRGRGQQVSLSAVKEVALAANLPVLQPEKIRAPEVQTLLEKLAPEVIVIIAYGQIIPARLLAIPRYGWINLHASLLPKYRGAAPINWAIANGETRTGLTTMRIDAGMDTGDILVQGEMDIGPAETAPELAVRMSEAGAPLMEETLRGLAAGTIVARPQNHAEASIAPILNKEAQHNRSTTACAVSHLGLALTRPSAARPATSGANPCLRPNLFLPKSPPVNPRPRPMWLPALCLKQRATGLSPVATQLFCACNPSNWKAANKLAPPNSPTVPALSPVKRSEAHDFSWGPLQT